MFKLNQIKQFYNKYHNNISSNYIQLIIYFPNLLDKV